MFSMHSIEYLHPRSLGRLSGQLMGLVSGRLWLKVLLGMAAGLVTGSLLGPSVGWVPAETGATIGNWLAFPGRLFLATIQMIVIPLVFASVIRGLAASENVEQLKKLGLRVVLFFAATTALAAVIGLTVAGLIRPGDSLTALAAEPIAAETAAPMDRPRLVELPEMLVGLLPGNPLNAMVEGQMLQIVIFSIVFGIALVSMAPTQSRPMLDLLGSLQEVCMTVVRFAMQLAPIAVFGLMAQLTTKIGLGALIGMAVYVLTVLLGLACMLVVYLLLLRVFIGEKPLRFLKASRDVLLLAFSTSSSATVMPLSIRTAVRDPARRHHQHERYGALPERGHRVPGAGVRGGPELGCAVADRGDGGGRLHRLAGDPRRGYRDPGHGAGDRGDPRLGYRPDHGCGPHSRHVADRHQRDRRPGHLHPHGEMGG